MLRLQLERLRIAGASELIISTASDATRPSFADGLPQVRWVVDAAPDGGPIAGIEAVFRAATQSVVLVVAVDLPALDPGFLVAMIARTSPGIGVVPRWNGRWEPLCAMYPREAALRGIGALDSRAPRDLVERGVAEGWMTAWDVPVPLAGNLANWNLPGDWTPG